MTTVTVRFILSGELHQIDVNTTIHKSIQEQLTEELTTRLELDLDKFKLHLTLVNPPAEQSEHEKEIEYMAYVEPLLLLSFIDENRLSWDILCRRPYAVRFLKANPKFIYWSALSTNPGAIDLLRENRDKIDWNTLPLNPNPEIIELFEHQITIDPMVINWCQIGRLVDPELRVPFLTKYRYHLRQYLIKNMINRGIIPTDHLVQVNIDSYLSGVYHTPTSTVSVPKFFRHEVDTEEEMQWLMDHPEKIDWSMLCGKEHPNAIKVVRMYMDKFDRSPIDTWKLSQNPCAVELLKEFPELIHWTGICYSSNPECMKMIDENIQRIDEWGWGVLARNPMAIPLLKKYPDQISYNNLIYNPSIFIE